MYAKIANHVNYVILVRGLNIDLVRNNAHTNRLCDISARHGLHSGKNRQKANYEYTYGVCMKELIINQILIIMCYPLYYMNV